MKETMRRHAKAVGRVEAFLAVYAALSSEKQDNFARLKGSCLECPAHSKTPMLTLGEQPDSSCATSCERGALYMQGWQEGLALGQEAWKTGNLAIFEEIGRDAGFTTRRPPRHYRGNTPERDGQDGNLHGEELRIFLSGWKQTCAEDRRHRGV
jgi:hypothetical protein